MTASTQVATRKSPLALKQTEQVLARLRKVFPDERFEALELSTQVDERLSWSLEKRGGLGLFTKELEEALLDERATLAVHSAKDLPTCIREGLVIAGYLPRAKPNDVLVYQNGCRVPEVIASSSPRRRAQVGRIFQQAGWTTIRGNVGTRLAKIAAGEAPATVLAAAGLERLGIDGYEGLEFRELSLGICVPAPGQAAIAVQCRAEDAGRYAEHLCPATFVAVELERAFLRRLGGGCQTPVGAHFADGRFHVFHPSTGRLEIPLDLDSEDGIETALDGVFNTYSFAEL